VPRLWIAICCVTLIACDKAPPSPPVVETPATPITINGTERLGWDQPASDSVELATISYVVYVDGARAALSGVACGSSAAAAGFPCTAALPSMTAGAHTLEIASFVNDGGVLESARSAPLSVTRVAQASAAAAESLAVKHGSGARSSIAIDGLESPIDLAFAPDGRLFIAERDGRIIIRPSPSASAGSAAPMEPAIALADTFDGSIQLLAIALDPQFARTHAVFTISAAPSRSGPTAFTLARFRESGGTLGDRAILLDGVAASASPAAALRFGPDDKLYAAFDDGGDSRRRQDPSSFNGKVLRLEADGTTPADAHGGTPVVAAGYGSPIAMDWDPVTTTLWVADRASGAGAFAFYRGALFTAWAGRLLGADALFARGVRSSLTFLTIGPDGAIYYGTAGGVGRVVPDRGP
jgi:hypothetical protein